MTSYIGLIRKHTHSDFGVDISDFPGCVIAGATLDAARHIAQEALELHIGSVVEDGEDLPAPSSLKRHGRPSEHRRSGLSRHPT